MDGKKLMNIALDYASLSRAKISNHQNFKQEFGFFLHRLHWQNKSKNLKSTTGPESTIYVLDFQLTIVNLFICLLFNQTSSTDSLIQWEAVVCCLIFNRS